MSRSATNAPRIPSLIASLDAVKLARTLASIGDKKGALDALQHARSLYEQTAWADTDEARARTESLFQKCREHIEKHHKGTQQ